MHLIIRVVIGKGVIRHRWSIIPNSVHTSIVKLSLPSVTVSQYCFIEQVFSKYSLQALSLTHSHMPKAVYLVHYTILPYIYILSIARCGEFVSLCGMNGRNIGSQRHYKRFHEASCGSYCFSLINKVGIRPHKK